MQEGPNPIFYGLLFVDDSQKRHENIRGTGDAFDIYLRCGVLCARSIAYHGYRFVLVTNDRRRVESRIQRLGLGELDILEQEFLLRVPENLQFRTAHFKLELFRLFASGSFGEHVGIVDLDCVMTARINFPPLPPGTILAYDITEQIAEEYAQGKVRSDLERVSGRQLSEYRWFGGEFLFGHAESFYKLWSAVSRIWPRYLELTSELHHVGDEMLIAAAVVDTELEVLDAGALEFIGRWWSARTNFKQMSFDAVARRCILHLPADKRVLAKSACSEFCPSNFMERYRRAARGKLFRRRVFNASAILVGRRRKHVARL
jgi:hypothetical protein